MRDHQPVVGPQPVDGRDELAALLVGEEQRLGRWGRIARGCIARRPQGQAGAPPCTTSPVASRIGHDAEQPGPEFGAGSKAAQRRMRPQESFLGGVACLIGVADDQVRGAVGDLLVAAHQLLEGRRVAASCRFDPFALEQWTALHLCHPYTARVTVVPVQASATAPAGRSRLSAAEDLGSLGVFLFVDLAGREAATQKLIG